MKVFLFLIYSEYDYYYRTITKSDIEEIMKMISNVSTNNSHKICMFLFKNVSLFELPENQKRKNSETRISDGQMREYMMNKIQNWKNKYSILPYGTENGFEDEILNVNEQQQMYVCKRVEGKKYRNNNYRNNNYNDGKRVDIQTIVIPDAPETIVNYNKVLGMNGNIYDRNNNQIKHTNRYFYK